MVRAQSDSAVHSTGISGGWPGADSRVIRVKAPLRLSFAGGGTDVPPFPELEGGCVLNATINQYSFGSLRTRGDGTISLRSADLGVALEFAGGNGLAYDGQLDLVKAAIRRLTGDAAGVGGGFDLFLHSEARPGSGLGSSSSLMVAAIGLIKEWRRLVLTDHQVAEMAYRLEREELGIPGGLQDQYAAAFGGWNFTEFGAKQVVVNPLRLPQDVINELEHNLVLCFTGTTRVADRILNDQTERFRRGDKDSVESLRHQKALALEMKNLLLGRHLTEFGQLLDEAWQYKKRLSPHISNPRLDEIYAGARHAGALGGKLNGAGGGGFMMFYCDFERRLDVAAALELRGCQVRSFAFEPQGLQTWQMQEARTR